MNHKAILEGLLFLCGSDGITREEVIEILEIDDEKFDTIINSLISDYEKEDRGVRLEYLGQTYKLATKKEHKIYYEKLVEAKNNNTLTQACLETLAIIAYNEPLTRVRVDDIRGVSSSHIVRKLVSMNLIEECGRADTPGRPNLYKTTKDFLDHFGLSNKDDLPPLEEEQELDSETNLFESRYKELSE